MGGITTFIDKFNYVRQIPIFSQLGWIDLQFIARKAIISEYKKGDVVRREGDPPDYLYCLVSGRLQTYTINESGRKDNVEFLHRGMYFGVISVFTGENHSLTFEAINDSIILKIEKEDFHSILKSIPKIAVDFSQMLSQRIRRKVTGSNLVFESNIISVYSPVKGTGSSTYAINLALSIKKETQKQVVFISINPSNYIELKNNSVDNGDSNFVEPSWRSRSNNLKELEGNHDKILKCIIKDDLKIDLLNVCFDPKDEGTNNLDASRKHIAPFVTSLVNDYHYIVVDLPNEMDDVVLEMLTQSDLVHLITTEEKNNLDLVRRVVDRLESKLKERFREEKIKVIISDITGNSNATFEEISKFIDYNIYIKLPKIDNEGIMMDLKSNHYSFLRCQHRSEYDKVVTRIARQIGEVLVGIALGGGAALGLAHIGVIRVLEKEGISVDMVSGSSMGALIGSLWAIGKTADEMEKLAREFEKRTSLLKLIDPVFPISGFIKGKAIKKWLRKHIGDETFYNTKIPLKVLSYDLVKREDIVINSGSIVDAVSQSIAIPGVFNPIKIGDQVIIDGGVLNPVPTDVLITEGIKKVISVNVLQSPEDVYKNYKTSTKNHKKKMEIKFRKHPVKFLLFRIGIFFKRNFNPTVADIIVNTLQATEYVIAEYSAKNADVSIHPDLSGIEWYELYRVDEIIKRGEDAALKVLPKIKQLIENS